MTVADTLARIFRFYAIYGDRDADGASMRSIQFSKLLRDAAVLDGRLTTHADMDIAFTKAVGKAGSGARMSFDNFVSALTDLASRRDAAAVAAGSARDEDPLRSLIQTHILPLYSDTLRTDPLFADASATQVRRDPRVC